MGVGQSGLPDNGFESSNGYVSGLVWNRNCPSIHIILVYEMTAFNTGEAKPGIDKNFSDLGKRQGFESSQLSISRDIVRLREFSGGKGMLF